MNSVIRRVGPNTTGRDFVVGDIHGHFGRLAQALGRVRFNEATDRLFSVGDLVDRGPESEDALEWLAYPWFYAVRGNHDDYVRRFDTCDRDNWLHNGGAWFLGLSYAEQCDFAVHFADLPYAIELELPSGQLVGIVHAGCPVDDWADLYDALKTRAGRDACMWSRVRLDAGIPTMVRNIAYVFAGHCPLGQVVRLGNHLFIDTCGWHDDGFFTLVELPSLRVYPASPAVLDWGK